MSYEIRKNDIFRFSYPEKTDWGWDSRYHCFECLLRVVADYDGNLVLRDTYWNFDGRDGRQFTLEQARKDGTLTFYFNVDDVDKLDKGDVIYYAKEDVFRLSRQNACSENCITYYKKRGAAKNQAAMKEIIKFRLDDAERDIRWAERKRDRYAELLTAVEAGNLEVYID